MIITPEPGMHKEIAQLLLLLANDPNEVQTELTPSLSFRVPLYVYEPFVAVMAAKEQVAARIDEPLPEGLLHLEGMTAVEVALALWQMPLEDIQQLMGEPTEEAETPEAEAATDAEEPAEAAAPKRRGRPARKQAAEGETE